MSGIRWGAVLPQGWRLDLGHLADPVAQFEAMVAVGREAEELGFDSVWLYDHLQPVQAEEEAVFECWTSLAAPARETRRVRLGQLVTCNLYRNPALLAKMAATLDAAGGGRALLGRGAGWDRREYEAYGYPMPYPGTGERLERLGEAVRVVTAMLRAPRSTVDGEHHRVRDAVNVPTGVQQPHVPLLIGGSGEKVTLRLVARYADACNLTDHTDRSSTATSWECSPGTVTRSDARTTRSCAPRPSPFSSLPTRAASSGSPPPMRTGAPAPSWRRTTRSAHRHNWWTPSAPWRTRASSTSSSTSTRPPGWTRSGCSPPRSCLI